MNGYLVCAHTGAFVLIKTIVAVLTEKSQQRATEQLTTWFALAEDRVRQKLGTEHVQQFLYVSPFVFTNSEVGTHILHILFACSDIQLSLFDS